MKKAGKIATGLAVVAGLGGMNYGSYQLGRNSRGNAVVSSEQKFEGDCINGASLEELKLLVTDRIAQIVQILGPKIVCRDLSRWYCSSKGDVKIDTKFVCTVK